MKKVAREILSYLAEHPEAQDTLEGIAEWWLPLKAGKPDLGSVERALTELVNDGLVLACCVKDTRTYYKVNRRKLKEISALLKKSRED